MAYCRHPLLLGDYLLQKDQQQAQQRSSSSHGNGARRSRRQFSNRKDDGDRASSDSDIDSEDESEARLGPPVSLDTWRANDVFCSALGCSKVQGQHSHQQCYLPGSSDKMEPVSCWACRAHCRVQVIVSGTSSAHEPVLGRRGMLRSHKSLARLCMSRHAWQRAKLSSSCN